jgi:FMN-dependent oxidoreductase (nitrilotriacetate monooxygenase family)
MAMPQQIHINLFEMNCVSHITHGLWALPGNTRHQFNDLEFWTEEAKLLEHGTFDAVFIADVLGAYDGFRNSPDTALREGMQIPNNDPLSVIPAMAAVTKNLGFAAVHSTSYEPPFAFARRMSTLDHLTKGRVGWNIVTSYLPNAARNFGLRDEIEHDRRYAIADEYADVVFKLWEGSWDDDAVIRDEKNRVYTDPTKVRRIDHVGEHFQVEGPHLSQPSRQRSPLIFQAGGSAQGRELAARNAEAVFVAGRTLEGVRQSIEDTKARASLLGRNPNHLKFFPLAFIITGADDAAVERRVAEYEALFSVEGYLTHFSHGLDWTRYPREERLSAIIERQDPGYQTLIGGWGYRPDQTVGDVLDGLKTRSGGPFFVAGTPTVVVDEIEKWVEVAGIDGFNLVQYHTPGTAEAFIELIVPELRRRGLFRESYAEGETLRERVYGPGHARLLEDHPGARYRDPAQLLIPRAPFTVATDEAVAEAVARAATAGAASAAATAGAASAASAASAAGAAGAAGGAGRSATGRSVHV